MLVGDIASNSERIVDAHKERIHMEALKTGIDVVGKSTLCDVFQVVERGRDPMLWNEVIKLKTIMPTTVCCEQGFSVTKRSLHVNMGMNTAIANVTNKIWTRTSPMEL